MAQTYRIRMSKGEQQFEAEGDKRFVLEMLKRFEGGGALKGASGGKAPNPAALAASKQVSVGEFIRELGVKKHTDLVVAFAYFLEEHSGLKEFTAADINNCYYESKMETSNVSQSIIQNIKRGYMMEAKGDKKAKKGRRYTVTASGQTFIKKIAAGSDEGTA
jgi:hypothetical protein